MRFRQFLFLAGVFFALTAPLRAAPITLISDSFADGGADNGADANDAAWTFANATGTVASDATLGGNALQVDATAAKPLALATFANTTLLPGDTLELTLRFRIYANSTASATGLRFGLGSSAGTYAFTLGTQGIMGGAWVRYTDGLDTSGNTTTLATTSFPKAVSDTALHTMSLKVSRASNTAMTLTAIMDGNTAATWAATDSSPLLTTFTGVVLGQDTTMIDILYDDVAVVFTPKTSTWNRVAHWSFDEAAIADEPQVFAWDKSPRRAHLALRQGGDSADLHTGATGLSADRGPSLAADDRALVIATAASHGVVINPQGNDANWQNFPGFTFCAWIKASAVPTGSQHLLEWNGSPDKRVQLWFSGSGTLNFSVGGNLIAATGSPFITAANVTDGDWVFVAVSYTAGLVGNGVKFYRGTRTGQPALVATAITPNGDTRASGNLAHTADGNLYLGNDSTLTHGFPGLIDDARIYDGALGDVAGSIGSVGNSLIDIARQALTPKNLLLNGDFERGALGGLSNNNYGDIASQWEYGYASGASPVHDIETNPANIHSGLQSQKVVAGDSGDLNPSSFGLVQGFELRGGQIYKMSVWVKALAAGARVRFQLRQNAPFYALYAVRTITLNDTAWHEVVFYGGTEHDTEVSFAVKQLNLSTIWIDDAAITEESDATDTTIPLTRGPVPGQFFGIHLNNGAFPVWPAMGQKTLRLWDTGTAWGDLELSKGVWQTGSWGMTRLNGLVNKAYDNTANPSIVYTMGLPPLWAKPDSTNTLAPRGHTLTREPPANLADWTNYVDTVARYPSNYATKTDPRNQTRRIKYWEIWNEFNTTGSGSFYAGSIPQLVALTKATRTAVQAVDPTAQILSPDITVSGLDKLEDFLENRSNAWTSPYGMAYPGAAGQFVDIWTFHTYGTSGRPESERPFYAAVKDMLQRFNQQAKPVWNTEGSEFMPGMIATVNSAGIVARKYITQWVDGISNFDWYAWDIAYPSNYSLGDFPTTSAAPNAAGIGYRETVNWLLGATMVSKKITKSQTGGERWVIELSRPGGYQGWIVWDTAGTYTWPLPDWNAMPTRLRTLAGGTRACDGPAISIGPVPLLLESGEMNMEVEGLGAYSYTGTAAQVGTVPAAPASDPFLSGGYAGVYNAAAPNDTITYLLPSVPAGGYRVHIKTKCTPASGTFQLQATNWALNPPAFPTPIATNVDAYAATDTYSEFPSGGGAWLWTTATSGDKLLKFTVTGKNAASSGYGLTLDCIQLERVLPTLSLLVLTGTTTEGSATSAQVSVIRTGDTATPVTATLALGGTATPGSDYATTPLPVNLGAGVTSAAINVEALADGLLEGPETVTVSLLPDPAYELDSSASVSVQVLDRPVDMWRFNHFTTTQRANPAIVDFDADPDGDGLANLMEYATGEEPLVTNSTGFPRAEVVAVGGVDYLALTFVYLPDLTDLDLRVETSDSPSGPWSSFNPLLAANQVALFNDTPAPGSQTITVRDTQPISASSRRFMRLGYGAMDTSLLAQWQFDKPANAAQTKAPSTTNFNDLELRKNTTPIDLRTSGTGTDIGPSGAAGDRSFNPYVFTLTPAPNGYNGSGRLLNPQSKIAWQDLSAFTFSAWIKVESVPLASQRLLYWDGAEAIQLTFPSSNSSGQIRLSVGVGTFFDSAAGFINSGDIGKWIFIAVTYTGGQGTNGVKFYKGTQTTAAALITSTGSTTTTGNIRNTGPGDFLLANTTGFDRPFPGQIDDVRFYGNAQTDIEAIRQSGLVPPAP